MSTPAQHTHAYNNTRRHRTPRVVRVVWDRGGKNLTLYFDRPMDSRSPLNVVVTICDGVNEYRAEFAGNWIWATEPQRLTSDDVTDEQAYTGPTFAVISRPGNVRAQGRYPALAGERCDRVEFI